MNNETQPKNKPIVDGWSQGPFENLLSKKLRDLSDQLKYVSQQQQLKDLTMADGIKQMIEMIKGNK